MHWYNRILCPTITITITIVICLFIGWTGALPWLSDISLDLLFRVRGVQESSQSIVIIGVDEKSLAELGSWPFDRRLHAQLLGQLKQAKGIGFDFIFNSRTDADRLFSQAIEKAPPVTLAVARDYDGKLLRPAGTLGNSFILGHIETILGKAGRIKTVLLKQQQELPLLALAVYGGRTGTDQYEDFSAPRLINFYGPEFTFLYLSYVDVLSGKISPGFFKDRFVLVGSQALALGDVHITPFSRKHPLPGVEIQATILNNLIDDCFLRTIPLATALFMLVILALSLFIWPAGQEGRNLITFLCCGLSICMLTLVGIFADFFIDPSLPLLALCIAYVTHLVLQGFWLANELINEIKKLDKQLDEGLNETYEVLPSVLGGRAGGGREKLAWSGGIRRHICTIREGLRTLSLQHQFVNHLLSEETPPLALWQHVGGEIVLANSKFVDFWSGINGEKRKLPSLDEFYGLVVAKHVCAEGHTPLTAGDILAAGDALFDLSLKDRGRKIYSRVLIHAVENQVTGFTGVLASFTDVTEIKELERLKGEVINIVSHELKLPLTTILGYGEMLTAVLDKEQKVYAEQICFQSKRLGTMIEDFLDIARIENGKYVINMYPLDLLTVAHDTMAAIEHAAVKKQITVELQLPQKVTPILGDEQLLTQAVLNLLDNAIKFSPVKSRVLFTVMEREDELILTVADEGQGIPSSEKKTIFDKFNRGKNQLGEKGFGLGLSFVQRVVEGHGGVVEVDTADGGGTEFRLVLKKRAEG